MASDGQIVFEVTADGKHAIADIKDITKTIQTETGKWDDAAKQSTDNINDSFSGMLKKIAAGFSAAKIGQALLNIGKQAVQAASDLEEVQNVVDTTFGENANQIERWAKKAGTQFGLTETQAKKFTSTMGAMLKSMGMSGNQIVDISTDLSGLAADMASFYNLDFEEAFAKIRSGLSGETEPLKQLGINMSTANLEAFALQQGLNKTWKEMSQGEQTMLRYQYLMQATADAQGDFAKTSDGYANGLRMLETNLESLKTNLGKMLIPAINEAVQALNGLFTGHAGERTVLDDFADIDAETQAKLDQIKKTSSEAGELVTELERIQNVELTKASGNVEKFVTDLSKVDLSNGKVTAVKDFVKVLNDNIDSLAQIQGTSNEEAKKWLDGIAKSANSLNPDDAKGWQDLVNTIKQGLPGLENTSFGQEFFNTLNGLEIGDKATQVKGFLKELSDNMGLVQELSGKSPEEAKKWLEDIGKAADSLDPNDAEGWKTLLDTIRQDLPGIENTTLGADFFDSINKMEIGDNAQTVKKFIEDLGNNMSLVQDLGHMDATEAKKWLEDIGHAADSLDPSDARGWNELLSTIKKDLPGIENTKLGADFFESFNNLKIGDKAQTIKSFIAELADNMSLVQSLSGEDAEGAKEWLKGIGEAADALSPEDAEGWEKLLTAIKDGLPGLEDTDLGKKFLADLANDQSVLKSETSLLDWALDNLGNKTNRTAEEQAYWLEVCKRLVQTIPGLSSIINTETGEIKGGTQAVKDYIKAWEEGQTKLVLLGALEEKESALSTRFADLPGLQLDMAVAERRARQQQEKLQKIYDKYGLGEVGYTKGQDGYYRIYRADWNGLDGEARKELAAAADELDKLEKEATDATNAYNKQKEALDEAKVALEEYRETIDEMPGSIEDATDASNKFWVDNAENIKTVVDAAHSALTAMADYAQGVKDNMTQAVNSVVSSLNGVNYLPNGSKQQQDKLTELIKERAKYKPESKEYKELQKQIDEINKSLVTTETIMDNLSSQRNFLDEYLKNLKRAREMGFDEGLLAELSDGSVESAQYLDALVNGATAEDAKAINDTYKEIQGKKAALAEELAQQQLSVDETYAALAEKAKEAVAALDLGEEANANAGKTISEMAAGISDHLPDVKDAVDGILSELDRLNGYGINIDFGGFGSINFTTSTGKTEGSGRMGIPLVPHDDYIARLHEGERVLTAQENQIWNALRNGGISGFDLETLGGVMRDNVKPGGNVYLDGRIVGSVISDQQGRSFRQLQRSGWQG